MRPTVVSGYMRDEKKFLMSPVVTKNSASNSHPTSIFSNSRAKSQADSWRV